MWSSIIAVVGTLLGGFAAHLTAAFTARSARVERRRQALVDAFPALLGALVDHRRHQYLKITARREGRADRAEGREARYEARSAVTKAMAAVQMATRDAVLLGLAREAVGAAFALGDAPESELEAAGDRARRTHDALQEAAASFVYDYR
ncbi:protein kilB [Streptomyces malaysiensis]|uniref:protein kilB n=1 Tax=Streptomyces malaysiensis TaxID=92644 RepID=UPI0011CEBC38|nr:protein kilB [Streptomyces malaysiensis]